MGAIEYATRNIVFNENSPIMGRFNLPNYPFIGRPLRMLDNIHCKVHTVYKASQELGTQTLLIATAYRLDVRRKTVYAIAQADDDAEVWAKKKVGPFLKRIPSLVKTVRTSDRNCVPITNTLWLWPNHNLQISGPGLSAQNSIDTCYLHMDEGHLYNPGTFAAFEDRMGGRWDRNMLNVTTAADSGHEVDQLFYKGGQHEWHLRCVHCNSLIWVLWAGPDKKHYNGERLFHWRDDGGENAILDSIRLICPHCQGEMRDEATTRREMDLGADYVPMNPDHDPYYESTRWNCFAAWWRSWRERLATYQFAISKAKLGDLKPHENWIKKHECRSYVPELPDFGTGGVSRLFSLGELLPEPDESLIMTADFQAGKKNVGSHYWALVTQWDMAGNSRRIAFERIETKGNLRAFQHKWRVPDDNVFVDGRHEFREVCRLCAEYHWTVLLGSDTPEFTHTVERRGLAPLKYQMPYSEKQAQNGNIGTPDSTPRVIRGVLPPGWAISRRMSNPTLYGYLYALQGGETGKLFEIPADIPEDYTRTFPAFMPSPDRNKKTGIVSIIWKQIKPEEHAWDCEVMALLGAMLAGRFPVDDDQPSEGAGAGTAIQA